MNVAAQCQQLSETVLKGVHPVSSTTRQSAIRHPRACAITCQADGSAVITPHASPKTAAFVSANLTCP